jgi:hypothetical protein
MRLVFGSALALALLVYVAPGTGAQAPAAQGQEMSRAVAGGGVSVPGWTGFVHPTREDTGLTLNDAKLTQTGNVMHVTTGPAVTYWNPANRASGDYTVKATFTEPKFQSLNNHAHPYGIVIAGNDMGTPTQSYLYCVAYGDGRFLVRGYSGPTVFSMNGRGAPAPSVNKAAPGAPVTQEIAMSVKGDQVTCSVNGAVVGTYTKADLVAAGKLKSTDGIYGFRFGHNTEGTVTGLTMTKN